MVSLEWVFILVFGGFGRLFRGNPLKPEMSQQLDRVRKGCRRFLKDHPLSRLRGSL